MKSSAIARWAQGHPLGSHVVLPAMISLTLMAMYFSGNTVLQSIVAPHMTSVPLFSAREFGALEMLQNVVLLCVGAYSLRCFLAVRNNWVKLVSLLLLLVSVFVFLEEIDYGAPFVEFFTGEHGSLDLETWDRNWHNKTNASGVQNVSYLKLAANIGLLAGFVLAPLLLSSVRNRTLRLLLPSRWMAATVVLIVVLSSLAHYLDDAGHAIIAGIPGVLDKNISEFRELNMYYIFLLYTAVLHERIIAGDDR